jgi:DNA gyrase subunit A
MFARLNDGDRVVMAQVLGDQETMMLASADGHVIHFKIEEINILSGAGKGVMGIKLADDDKCLGGLVLTRPSDQMQVETSGGKVMEFSGRYETVSRGGKGFEAVKRTSFVRVLPGTIELVDWDVIEGRAEDKAKGNARNGQKTLFD